MLINELMRPDLQDMDRYISQQTSGNESRLNANELPWDPLAEQQWQLNRYPDVAQQKLLKLLAAYYQVRTEQLLLSRGSDEGIDTLMRLFITPFQDSVMICPPTFGMYTIYAQIQGARILHCPLRVPDYGLDFAAIQQNMRPKNKLLFICRPNNPTGNCEPLAAIAKICHALRKQCIVVVDEAYLEFSSEVSATTLLDEFENLVVLKTLSKAYGLAGLRLGACIANPYLIEKLRCIQAPYAISTPTVQLALRALQNPDWFLRKIETIKNSRTVMFNVLCTIPVIKKCWPSEANFFFIQVENAEKITDYLSAHGIIIRRISERHCRLSIGDEGENTKLINLMKAYRTPNQPSIMG